MNELLLARIRDIIQEDVGERGLAADPDENLISYCANDFQAACRSVAAIRHPALAIVTGFYIPHATPPAGETDGPLGALFLARALVPLGIRVAVVTDAFCRPALEAGLTTAGLEKEVPILTLPPAGEAWPGFLDSEWRSWSNEAFGLTHLVALERVGPSHSPNSLRLQPDVAAEDLRQFISEVPEQDRDRCHTMRGVDVTERMSPAHLLFEDAAATIPRVTTIGIGDGGNEIGMGKIPWRIIRRNIPRGGFVACRVPTDHLIVCGVSNWGAYGLAAGIQWLRAATGDPHLFDSMREQVLLQVMLERGPLVDGVSGKPTLSVDGLSFERYIEPLERIGELVGYKK
jgi:hypothetical protein